ncbi:MAG: GNAT family N-acetyltransferase [Planctomycetota bacterium]|nr:GNAT family N-acetyltransferase [Planctomycetota bacterium]
MTVRPARTDELSRVFRLTYDLGNGGSMTQHVVECKRNRKLWSGMHYVLEAPSGEFVATLTAYLYRHPHVATAIGFANVFTPEPLRNRGFASRLIEGTVDAFESQGHDVFYLLSDIGTDFYSRFGFKPLPLKYEAAPESLTMLRCPEGAWPTLSGHGQFLRGLFAFVD